VAEADGEGRAAGAAPDAGGGAGVTDLRERFVDVGGQPCRVWEKGEGASIGFLAGLGGLMRWTPFLDRLAARRRVVAPSLPGFPGAGRGHDALDSHLDWLVAAHDLLTASDLAGADLVGVSIGGALAADVAALWPETVKRLVLVAPLGIYDAAAPVTDVWAQPPNGQPAVLSADPEAYAAATALPEGEDLAEWQILQIRANEAAARLLWPLSDTRLAKRLPRIRQPTLIVWGENDRVLPPSYARRFAEGIAGPSRIELIAGAGHLADIDAPDALAAKVLGFLD
jgi:pimeloyl-ACP methyl ester carboxylesterase